ncbi:TPA: hypothetical protein DCR79_02105 [Patescibacteria group bacterium]|uniref:Uncharacterized protein n=2 Tax=Bacteria division Kazan-3B-28 TaxID=1798534 RepID=A0A0G1NS71_UNCK3|nr:MAG: hypothetical protein VE96_C0014G0006 [candidate division Kazan bacterium GW2011_GWA1_44_22]KKT87044.1 MAG: hypothetical protein VE97_C0007G0002 [candidate division Kazan bacterium GW2011_GWB1_45_10]HAR55057.1 hypothetical protein [Patescibacteria group bacterium]HCR42278.1 hypothetical protein [Patescibacteria group bacterium]
MILEWLWKFRKLLLLEVLLIGLMETMYWWPKLLVWWLIAVAVVVLFFAWWIGNAKISRNVGAFAGELTWAVLSGIGFLAFSLFNFWQVQLTILVVIAIVAFVVYCHQNRVDTGQWSLPAINWLGSIDLLILFVATLSLMLMVRFYTINIAWLMVGMALQLILALYLLFWRQNLPLGKFWLYAAVLALVGEEVVWLTSAWNKNAYFKAFILLVIYYLFSELVLHYLKGNLTVRVVFEYIGIALVLMLALFIFDWLFVLAPSIL